MLVTAIMPTRGRPAFAEKALVSFLSQTWHEKELVIIDDADDPSFDVRKWPSSIDYHRRKPRVTIGQKRNWCCELARGDVIAHWDSDDWSAPDRIRVQVELMQESGKAVVGFHALTFFDVARNIAVVWDSTRQLRTADYALGSSLMYRRDWWKVHRFPHDDIGEDNTFVGAAVAAGQLFAVPGGDLLIARIHAGNTSPKDTDGMQRLKEILPPGFLP